MTLKGFAAVRIAFAIARARQTSALRDRNSYGITGGLACILRPYVLRSGCRFRGRKRRGNLSRRSCFGLMPLAVVSVFAVWVILLTIHPICVRGLDRGCRCASLLLLCFILRLDLLTGASLLPFRYLSLVSSSGGIALT